VSIFSRLYVIPEARFWQRHLVPVSRNVSLVRNRPPLCEGQIELPSSSTRQTLPVNLLMSLLIVWSASLCVGRLGWLAVPRLRRTIPCFASDPHLPFGQMSSLAIGFTPRVLSNEMPDDFFLLRLSLFIRCYSYKHTLGMPVHFGRVRFLLATNLGRSCMRVAFPSLSDKSVHYTDCFHNLCHARALGGQIQKKFSG